MMKSMAFVSGFRKENIPGWISPVTVNIDGTPFPFGLIDVNVPEFNTEISANRKSVLVRKKAFSCNYREISIIRGLAQIAKSKSPKENNAIIYSAFGSDFVGEVIAVGAEVRGFQVGDRVMPNGCYQRHSQEGINNGLPTNFASRRFEVFHHAKIIRIPETIPDIIAAAFTVGAQTVYSMTRRLDIQGGENILVTAAKSNTSLFAINRLRHMDVNIFAVTTSPGLEQQLKNLGVAKVFRIGPGDNGFLENTALRNLVEETGGFDLVIDPLMNVHLASAIQVMAPFGKYISCGGTNEAFSVKSKPAPHDTSDFVNSLLFKCLTLMGNCLGQTGDLENAIEDYVGGKFDVPIDSVYEGNQVAAFLDRTFNSKNRFGKVVYRYE